MLNFTAECVPLGKTELQISPLGIGAWQWGDKFFWDYGKGSYTDADLEDSFKACLANGINFYDTAESYGSGRSETLLGQFVQHAGAKVVIATKFMPYPWRIPRGSLVAALRKSLQRLQAHRVDLYQIHMPFFPMPTSHWVNALADAFDTGLVRVVGVSNYSAEQTRQAYEILARRGIPLASNQVNYSLFDRRPERNGVSQTCRELGVTLIAYSPLAQGLLTGKFTSVHMPTGIRRTRYGPYVEKIQPLIAQMRKVGAAHDGKSPAQVALNWCMCKGSVPIPGSKNLRQAMENIGALNWRMTGDEVASLDEISDQVR